MTFLEPHEKETAQPPGILGERGKLESSEKFHENRIKLGPECFVSDKTPECE